MNKKGSIAWHAQRLCNTAAKLNLKVAAFVAAVLIGGVMCAFADASEVAEIAAEASKANELWWIAKWFLVLPLSLLAIISLITKRGHGWGWVIAGSLILIVLGVAQFFWSIVTSFRGDPSIDEDYFRPLDNWTSDSFDA